MNWPQLINDLRKRGETFASIAEACGFSSRGHVHDLWSKNSAKVSWDVGDGLIRFHKRVMRRKAKS